MDLGTLNRAGTAGRLVSLVLSLASLLLVWWLAAQLAATPLLPGPAMVFAAIAREAASGDLVHHTAITLIRVLASFLIAMAIGSAIGLALGRREALNRLFDSWLLVALNMPALVVIVLAYVWFGLTEAAAVGAVAVNKIPTVAVTLREGARALDRDLDEMARSFRLGRGRRLWRIVLPQLVPYLFAAGRSGLALIWKIVLVVELLGRSNGVGFKLYTHFQLFEMDAILAYALTFIVVMQAFEWLVLRPMERRANRWRRT